MTATISDVCAVVPAAGFSQRMHAECPKQYLSIGNKTILEHTVTVLLSHPSITRAVIVVNPGDIHFTTTLLSKHPKITVIHGGTQRADSVLAGIQAAGNSSWVLVHDAARPCLQQSDLTRLLTISKTNCIGGILATPVRDTIKRAKPNKMDIAHTVGRIGLWHALTPQLFPLKLLRGCLIRALNEGAIITDEASALEYCGFHPKMIEGRSDNIKITYLEDLKFAEFCLKHITD